MKDHDALFASRTFHTSDFEPVEELAALKGATTVSVALPAKDEALTIGPIVKTIREILVERHRLVDELIVMDAGSSDHTPRVAEDAGARVVDERDVLPAFRGGGKGDALWKSLLVSRGDILLWVDADIRNFHPRFVYGLAGPLLREPGVQLVKGFYERPIADDTRLRPTGGGRVTELVARPLINMFWPELAWIIQPLSGEYGGRRSLLERIPFVTGYGVELAMLVDVAEEAGVDAIAQVDLETRVHRNQSIRSLSRMSFGILHTALGRLERQGRVKLQAEPRSSLLQFLRRRDRYEAREAEITIAERPPMIEVPEYRARR